MKVIIPDNEEDVIFAGDISLSKHDVVLGDGLGIVVQPCLGSGFMVCWVEDREMSRFFSSLPELIQFYIYEGYDINAYNIEDMAVEITIKKLER